MFRIIDFVFKRSSFCTCFLLLSCIHVNGFHRCKLYFSYSYAEKARGPQIFNSRQQSDDSGSNVLENWFPNKRLLASRFVNILERELLYYTSPYSRWLLDSYYFQSRTFRQQGYLSQLITNVSNSIRLQEWRDQLILSRKMSFRYQLSTNATEVMKKSDSPILTFINKKSGGKRGSKLISDFFGLLNPAQICDLSSNEFIPDYFKAFNSSKHLRILIGGGDGTVSWIMDEAKKANPNHNFTFGIIPLGTGNDMYLHLTRFSQDKEFLNLKNHDSYTNNKINGSIVESPANQFESIDTIKLNPNMLIASPDLMLQSYQDPIKLQVDRWSLTVQRMYGRRRKLLKLFLLKTAVKSRNNVIIAFLARVLSNIWGFGRIRKKRDVLNDVDEEDREDQSDGTMYNQMNNIDFCIADGSTYNTVNTNRAIITSNNESLNSLISTAPVTKCMINTLSVPSQLVGTKDKYESYESNDMKYTMNNYFGIGVDGAVSLGFHNFRQKVPVLFFHRYINKLWYGLIGIRTVLFGRSKDLSKCVQLICDNQLNKVPHGIQGIIVLNINSYAGGSKMWTNQMYENNNHAGYKSADSADAMVEVCTVEYCGVG